MYDSSAGAYVYTQIPSMGFWMEPYSTVTIQPDHYSLMNVFEDSADGTDDNTLLEYVGISVPTGATIWTSMFAGGEWFAYAFDTEAWNSMK